jgi:3-methylcrotonyl-CoA carboxylase alpha subunit
MKMEMTLAAPRDGVVAEIRVEEGAQVSEGTVLMTLEKEGAAD